jgi:nitroreductase
MDILDVINNRRSVRSYCNNSISDDKIKEILHYGTLAPSAKNKQPWIFVVIKEDQKLKNKIVDLMIEKSDQVEKFDPTVVATANTIKQAPILVLVFNKFREYHLVSNTLSIGACIENMLLTATNYNIGSLWIRNTDIIEDEICKMLNKEDMTLASAVALGIANEDPIARPRLKIEEITEWK